MKGSRAYRARKAMELRWTEDMTHEEIADELDVTRKTVSQYLNDPPEELKEPARHFRQEIIQATLSELREQLTEARERARTAETTEKVFETDENGNLVTERVETDDGQTFVKPKVKGMEFAADHKVRSMARREVREIISMLWDLVGAEEPDEQRIEHTAGEGEELPGVNIYLDDEYVDD